MKAKTCLTALVFALVLSATVPLAEGTNVVSIVAQPSSGATPVTTQREQIIATGTAPTALTYDANGNLLTDQNGNTYQWDALNRLAKITYPSTAYTTFAYDGLSRRTQIAEYDSTHSLISTKKGKKGTGMISVEAAIPSGLGLREATQGRRCYANPGL